MTYNLGISKGQNISSIKGKITWHGFFCVASREIGTPKKFEKEMRVYEGSRAVQRNPEKYRSPR